MYLAEGSLFQWRSKTPPWSLDRTIKVTLELIRAMLEPVVVENINTTVHQGLLPTSCVTEHPTLESRYALRHAMPSSIWECLEIPHLGFLVHQLQSLVEVVHTGVCVYLQVVCLWFLTLLKAEKLASFSLIVIDFSRDLHSDCKACYFHAEKTNWHNDLVGDFRRSSAIA